MRLRPASTLSWSGISLKKSKSSGWLPDTACACACVCTGAAVALAGGGGCSGSAWGVGEADRKQVIHPLDRHFIIHHPNRVVGLGNIN